MRKRINRLESSILSLMSSEGGKKAGEESLATPQSLERVLEQAGGQKISLDTRSTHWDAVLAEVSTIRFPRSSYSQPPNSCSLEL